MAVNENVNSNYCFLNQLCNQFFLSSSIFFLYNIFFLLFPLANTLLLLSPLFPHILSLIWNPPSYFILFSLANFQKPPLYYLIYSPLLPLSLHLISFFSLSQFLVSFPFPLNSLLSPPFPCSWKEDDISERVNGSLQYRTGDTLTKKSCMYCRELTPWTKICCVVCFEAKKYCF